MSKIKEHLESGIKLTPAVVCFLRKDNKVTLGLRKRVSLGLGENLISGIGGKVGDKPEFSNETDDQALEREVFEEIGVKVLKYSNRGRVRFVYPFKPKWNLDVRIYVVDLWKGDPVETEDMKPLEFDINNLPSERMWEDNQYWVPKVLKDEYVDVIFLFGEDGKILEYEEIEKNSNRN
jgi:8-oxo-dGTP diphosphatase